MYNNKYMQEKNCCFKSSVLAFIDYTVYYTNIHVNILINATFLSALMYCAVILYSDKGILGLSSTEGGVLGADMTLGTGG